MRTTRLLIGLALPLILHTGSRAQCVTTYPALEDFEAAPVWTINGVLPDWAWGTPAHPLINGAGGGSKSWCAGNLSGTFYNYGEHSWIESPCYDMTTLLHPWTSFKLFWETEQHYDGANLQYSINGGTTWTNLGAFGDPVDCANDNWFNHDNILNLTLATPKNGWSGRVGATIGACQGGSGSAAWLEAKHCLPAACAGQPDVRFRFLFGSGTTCNDYDGFAIDDFLVGEAPVATASIAQVCTGYSVDFSIVIGSGCTSSFAWDFGDPASGAANTSTLAAPTHVFSGGGTFTVNLTVYGPCNGSTTALIAIEIADVSINVTNPLCADSTGSLVANTSGATSALTYSWSPGGATSQAIAGLAAGAYTVSATTTTGCTTDATASIVAPPAIWHSAMNDTILCAGANVNLEAYAGGGTGALNFTWTPTGPLLSPAVSGTYMVNVTDANGCTAGPDTVLVDVSPPIVPAFTHDPSEGCAPLCVDFTDLTTNASDNAWDFGDGSTTSLDFWPQHCYTASGWFAVALTVTDAAGCSGTTVVDSAVHVFTSPDATFSAYPPVVSIDEPTIQFITAVGNIATGNWQFGDPLNSVSTDASPSFTYADVGCFTVTRTVTSTEGCMDSTSLLVCVEDEFALYAPNAFTPDGDGINEEWIPITTVFFPKEYALDIYDRWGLTIFTTTDVHETWKGDGAPIGVYVWKLRMRDSDGRVREGIGHVAVVR